jgi:hypothetical protein
MKSCPQPCKNRTTHENRQTGCAGSRLAFSAAGDTLRVSPGPLPQGESCHSSGVLHICPAQFLHSQIGGIYAKQNQLFLGAFSPLKDDGEGRARARAKARARARAKANAGVLRSLRSLEDDGEEQATARATATATARARARATARARARARAQEQGKR